MGCSYTTTHKLCSKCKFWKTLRQFKEDPRYMANRFCWCKKCESAYSKSPEVRKRSKRRRARDMSDPKKREAERKRSRDKYWKDPRKQKDQIYRRKYGISLRKFERSKYCSLCRRKCRLVPDHDHELNKYRGPLCHLCNLTVSQIDNHPGWLKRVKKYLGIE